jgi:hypothetical protein
MVGAGQHEQTSGDKVVAGVDTRGPRAVTPAVSARRSPLPAARSRSPATAWSIGTRAHAGRIAVPDSRAH